MALWMDTGAEPKTDKELADLDAIAALKESTAFELKENGNEYVKKGKKFYSDAIDCYTRAINQKVLGDSDTSILYSNRAHVNLLLGNYRRALEDADEAVKLCPANVKAHYRAAKAALSLNLLADAKSRCVDGIHKDPNNEELKKLAKQIDQRKSEQERREAEVSKAVAKAKNIVSAIEERKLKFGKAMYQELTGLKRPVLDKNNILHWPVILLYAEVMSSDIIEDFCEIDMFSAHLDIMFSEDSPLPWDGENNYRREAIELYYEAGSGIRLPRSKVLRYFLDGTAASNLENVGNEEGDKTEDAEYGTTARGGGSPKWVRVNEKKKLIDILKEPDYVIPGIPVFYVVSKRSSFYKDFKAGKWTPPP